jgi:hypothetical protein
MSDNNFDPNTGMPTGNVYVEPRPANPYPNSVPPPQYGPNPYMEVPPEIRKWNWGAFYFGWAWGVGNKAYLALLTLVPCFNFIWMFFCGALGNQWAWKSGEFKDVEQFMAVQRTWNRAGFISFLVTVGLSILGAISYAALIAWLINSGIFDSLSYY